ncbi:MAG: nucleotide exchange factor GrpE [Burkholderiaceae bacterium]|nr:nucleotide exchange factor GrpE [Burkholderiaceae bacterium]
MQDPETPASETTAIGTDTGAQNGAENAADDGPQTHAAGDSGSELQQARARADEYYDQFLRSKAEAENMRRRAQEDVAKAYKFAIESFAEALVPVADSLEQALQNKDAAPEAMREGIELTLRQLKAAFAKGNLKEIDPAGQKFDPHFHQAISVAPAEGVAPNHVAAVLQKGWLIADRVLRPALVTVAQA